MPQHVGPGRAQGHRRRRDDATTVARLRARRRHPARRHQRLRAVHVDGVEQPRLRPHQQPVRLRAASSAAARAARARSSAPAARPSASARHRRLDPHAGVLQRRLRPQADRRPGAGHAGSIPVAHERGDCAIVATGPLVPPRRGSDAARARPGRPRRRDDGATAMALGDPAAVRIDGLTVVDVEDNGARPGAPPSSSARAAARRPRRSRARGARIRRVRFGVAAPARSRSGRRCSPRRAGSRSACCSATARRIARRARARALGGAPLAAHAAGDRARHARARRAAAAPGARGALRRARPRRCARELSARIGDARRDALSARTPRAAPRHYKPLWPPFNWVYTAIFNVHASCRRRRCRSGSTPTGLPLGVQVVAAHGARSRHHRRGAGSRARIRRLGSAAGVVGTFFRSGCAGKRPVVRAHSGGRGRATRRPTGAGRPRPRLVAGIRPCGAERSSTPPACALTTGRSMGPLQTSYQPKPG